MSESQKMNFRYKCKINDIVYNIQLFNIQHEKIKIMIDIKNPYSDDYIEYSNIYTLNQFQEITRYYVLFQNIDELFEDLSRTIKEKNFSISHNGKLINLTIRVIINQNVNEVNFILDKNKVIDLSLQKDNPYFYINTASSGGSWANKNKNSIEKSKRNVEISNINELNTILSDLKDRITVLESSQNNEMLQNNKILYTKTNNTNLAYNNDNTFGSGLDNILIRLNKLEKETSNKDKIIEQMEQKIKYYESIYKNPNNNIDNNYLNNNNHLNTNNNYTNYNVPIYSNIPNNSQLLIKPTYYKYPLQSERLYSFTLYKNRFYNKNNNYNNYRLKQSKSEIYNSYNNENMSFDTKKEYYRNASYNDKKISFRDNNKSFGEKETFRSNRINNNSYANDINSNNFIKSNNSYLNTTMSNNSNAVDKNFNKYLFYKEKLGIPLVPREDLKKYVNSRIIFTKNELRLLKSKLSNGNKKIHIFFDLLYRASVDGDVEEMIKNNIEDKEKLLTLFYTYEGARFGVYINRKKTTSLFKGKIYKEIPGTSFIVSLNYSRFFDISPNRISKEDSTKDCLCFGKTFYLNSNGSNWLINTPRSKFLKKRCIIGNQSSDYMYFNPEIIVGNKKEYHIKDVEIFHVAIEKDRE